MLRRSRQKKYSNSAIVLALVVGIICLGIGFGYGQASVYKKQHDKHSVEDIYNNKESVE